MNIQQAVKDALKRFIGPREGIIEDLADEKLPARPGFAVNILPHVIVVAHYPVYQLVVAPDQYVLSWCVDDNKGRVMLDGQRRRALLDAFRQQIDLFGEVRSLPDLSTLSPPIDQCKTQDERT
jgi:hypothetical protein